MSSDQQESEVVERRRGQHLTLLDRGVIEAGLRAGRSFRAIARELKCSPSTVSNEVKRGTPDTGIVFDHPFACAITAEDGTVLLVAAVNDLE